MALRAGGLMGGVQEGVYDGPEEGGGGLEIARERVTVLYGRLCVDHLDKKNCSVLRKRELAAPATLGTRA